jgi:hypothetical protein
VNVDGIIEWLGKYATGSVQQYIFRKEIRGESSSPAMLRLSKWYVQLASEQRENGSWGNFHSMSSSTDAHKKFVSTEAGLRRARDLSLPIDDPVVAKGIALMERYLTGEEYWPDYTEMHHDYGKSFHTAFPFMIAANLSMHDPDNPLVAAKREICVRTLEKAFAGGSFNEDIWEAENKNYTGPCLRAWMVYPVWLMSKPGCMDEALQRKYLDYLWRRKEGIYYIYESVPEGKLRVEDKKFTSWLSALEALSGYSLFPEFMQEDVLPHLLGESERLMDDGQAEPSQMTFFGQAESSPKNSGDRLKLPHAHLIYGHYAESWHQKEKRRADLVLRIMRTVVKVTK